VSKGISDSELFDTYEKAEVSQVRSLARAHTIDAINTLVTLMKAPRTPPGVKRQCAADILAQGWGRPDARGDGGDHKSSGLVINILKLSTGVVQQVAAGGEVMQDVQEAVDVAGLIASENS
jgi:hypothetical protein